MPLLEVVGSIGAVEPEHNAVIKVNSGVILESTVTVKVALIAHWPAFGVKV